MYIRQEHVSRTTLKKKSPLSLSMWKAKTKITTVIVVDIICDLLARTVWCPAYLQKHQHT